MTTAPIADNADNADNLTGNAIIGRWLMVAVAYLLASQFGTLFAVPPGFASAIWPPAGIALAAALVWGRHAYPGIYLGSLATNLLIASPSLHHWQWSQLLAPALIACGAVAQGAVGRWLINRYLPHHILLYTSKEIALLMGLGGPLACLVGASVGVMTITLLDISPPEAMLFSWGTWWAGDCIGAMTFTPLLLLWAQGDSASRARFRRVAIPIGAILLLVAAFLASAKNAAADRQQLRFETTIDAVLQELADSIGDGATAVETLRAFFEASDNISRDDFHRFVSQISRHKVTVAALEWSPRILASTRNALEQELSAIAGTATTLATIDNGKRQPVSERPFYFPVRFVEPLAPNIAALGLDLYAQEQRLATLLLADRGNMLVASAPIHLIQGGTGVLLIAPVRPYSQANAPVSGYVLGVFRINDWLSNAWSSLANDGISLKVDDLNGGGEPLYDNGVAPGQTIISRTLMIGGRQWQLNFSASPSFFHRGKDWTLWAVLSLGLLFTVMLCSLLLLITGTTARVEAEVAEKTAALRAEKERSDRANAAKSEFLANMSHEVRTPINAISGLLALAGEQQDDQLRRNYLGRTEDAVKMLLRVVNDILDYSKMEAGRLTLDLHPFNLHEALHNVAAIIRPAIQAKGLTFKVRIASTIPRWVKGDRIRLEQILLNLLNNALKFTEQGWVEMVVAATPQDEDSLRLTISVNDSGIGISSDILATLFTSFTQADSSITRRFGGTGLGLAICRSLIALMGGEIRARSEPGQGSSFEIVLPLTPTEPPPEAVVVSPPPATSLAGKRVLVVEDQPINRELLIAMLEKRGIAVYEASNGEEALERLAKQPVDLVVMDLQMPVMDGLTAVTLLRADPRWRDLPVIALSAHAFDEDRERSLAAGMNEHLTKPVDQTSLFRTLERYLG